MPFAAATAQKIGKYLGYSASNASEETIASALADIEAMTNATYSAAAIVTIEGLLAELDTISTGINTQRSTEGSTLLPELRREYRRCCSLGGDRHLSNRLRRHRWIYSGLTMALTPADIESLRRFLGYPAGGDYIATITNRCAEVLSPESEVTVKDHLRQLGRLQTQLTSTVPFAAETFNSGAGGTRQYAPGQRMQVLHQEANQYIDEIANTTGLAVYRRIYGGGGGQWSGGRTIRG